jgi:hypothetical protein
MFKKTGQKIWNLVDQHLGYVFECYCAFEKFMEEALGGTPGCKLGEMYTEIDKFEGAADVARRNLVNAFLDGSLLPSTRKEIMDVVNRMDKVANKCQDVACKIVHENVRIPQAYRADMLEITRITKEQYLLMKRALKILFDDYDQLIKDESILDDIMAKEYEVDKIEDAMTIALYKDESLGLAEKNHYKYFLSNLADISDMLEDIADHIQIICVLRKV